METYRACHMLGVRGPVMRNVPSDYYLISKADLTEEEGVGLIRKACEEQLARGLDVTVLFHFNRMHDPRARVFLREYLDISGEICGLRGENEGVGV